MEIWENVIQKLLEATRAEIDKRLENIDKSSINGRSEAEYILTELLKVAAGTVGGKFNQVLYDTIHSQTETGRYGIFTDYQKAVGELEKFRENDIKSVDENAGRASDIAKHEYAVAKSIREIAEGRYIEEYKNYEAKIEEAETAFNSRVAESETKRQNAETKYTDASEKYERFRRKANGTDETKSKDGTDETEGGGSK